MWGVGGVILNPSLTNYMLLIRKNHPRFVTGSASLVKVACSHRVCSPFHGIF